MIKIRRVLPLCLALMLVACGSENNTEDYSVAVANVSSDSSVQAAYAGCTRDMAQELLDDNPGSEPDILHMMLQLVPEMCNGAVVKPCTKDREGFLCKTMIEEYTDK